MKLILAILTTAMLFISNQITAQNKTITATVVNVTSDLGKVGFALYNKTTFMKTPIQSKNAKIIEGKSTVTFENLEELIKLVNKEISFLPPKCKQIFLLNKKEGLTHIEIAEYLDISIKQ